MLNSFQHLRLNQTFNKEEEILNQVQDDNIGRTASGFTLIELLVVVLIIGILAAVAVPQYQKAVEKSKAAQALSLLKSLAQATRVYYLANGKYPTKFEQLDVDMTTWTGTTAVHRPNINIYDTKSNEDWSLQLWSDDPGNSIMIMCLRTSGKYKAGGFVIDGKNSSPTCAEDSSSDFPLSKKGMYCEKLFNGTVIDPTNSFRQYKLH